MTPVHVTARSPTPTLAGSETDRPRVVHVLPALPVGGVESVVRAMAVARHRRGWPTEVIALLPTGMPSPHEFVDQLRADGVPVTEVRSSHRGYSYEATAVAAIGSRGPTVVHTHKFRGDVAGYWGSRRTDNVLVATVHGFTANNTRVRCYQWLDRRLLRRFDAVIAVSGPLRALMVDSGLSPARVHQVHNALPPTPVLTRGESRARLGLDPDTRIVGWVGRLSVEKGPDLMIDAVHAAQKRDFLLVVLGDGPERERMRDAAARRGLATRVRFAGALSNASALLPAFDALALSSRNEGCPTIVLEAIAAGVPIAAFSVGGVPEILSAETARLVRPGDAEALGHAVVDCLDNVAAARQRAEAALLASARRLDLDGWLDRVESVYSEALATRGGEPHRR